MIQAIHETIAAALERRSLDWRTCFTEVRAEPPEGRTVIVECSNPEVLAEVRGALSGWVADGKAELRFEALPSPREALPDVCIASVSVVDVRRQAAHGAELTTQLTYGDVALPLKREGEWLLVRLDDGYVGWVRSWHLAPLTRREHETRDGALRHRVRENVVTIYEAAEETSRPVTDAVVGTPVRADRCERRGWRRVTLPDNRQGFVKAGCLEKRIRARRAAPRPAGEESALREDLAATALRFLGIPYVWGGTTPKGFDCSGLTQRVYRLGGIVIPRDSDMQARFGVVRAAGDIDGLRIGELLFFGSSAAEITHVAMALSNGLFVHARGQVRVNALLPSHPLFDEQLVRAWRLVSDPVGG